MTENQFEQFFKDRLDQYASPVNSEVLDKVFRERAKRKKRPGGKWWLLPLILLVSGGGYFIYLRFSPDNEALRVAVAASSVPENKQTPGSPDSNSNESTTLQENISDRKPTNHQEQLNRTAVFDKPAGKESRIDQSISLSSTLSGEQNSTNHSFPATALKKDSFSDRNYINQSAQKNSYKNTTHRTKEEHGSQAEPYREDKQYSSFRNIFNLAILNTSHLSWTDQFDLYKQIRGLSLSRGNHFPFCIPDCNFPGCPNFKGPRRKDWYIEAFASLDIPSKKLENQSTKSDFVQAKDSTETMLPSYTLGVRISKNITNSWLIKTGLHYSRINERFDYHNENEKRFTTIITIRTIIRGPGDTLIVTDTSFIQQTGTHIRRTYNKYRNIDIPVILSYEVRNPDFTIGVQGGLLFNLRSWYTGDMLDTSMIPMSQTAKNPKTQFRTRIGVGVYAGVSFVKPVSNTWDLFAEPWYRRYLQNQAVADAPFRQNISSWGLQLGVRYKINAGGQRKY